MDIVDNNIMVSSLDLDLDNFPSVQDVQNPNWEYDEDEVFEPLGRGRGANKAADDILR